MRHENGASQPPEPVSSGPAGTPRIATLDGLRGVSIAFVLIGHLAGTRGSPFGQAPFFAALAELGVRVFFVLSGFLITHLLLSEARRNGRIDLPTFYFRRALRIFVPYYAFLIGVAILDGSGVVSVPAHDLAVAATYRTNYLGHAAWPVAHTWSLSVEEQFYLLWPAALVWLGTRRAPFAALAVIALAPLGRVVLWEAMPAMRPHMGLRFEFVADALATGCLLACARRWLGTLAPYRRLLGSRAFPLVPLAALALIPTDQHPLLAFAAGQPLQHLAIALTVDWCLRHPDARPALALSWRPLVRLGAMSYACYLWQQIFLDRTSLGMHAAFPWNFIAVVVATAVSYHGIERTSLWARPILERRFLRRVHAAPADAWQEVAPAG